MNNDHHNNHFDSPKFETVDISQTLLEGPFSVPEVDGHESFNLGFVED